MINNLVGNAPDSKRFVESLTSSNEGNRIRSALSGTKRYDGEGRRERRIRERAEAKASAKLKT